MPDLDKLFKKARELPAISSAAAREYGEKGTLLINHVNTAIENNPRRSSLLGSNPLQVVYDNHTNHFAFMTSALQMGLYEMMVRLVLWVYRSYHARGFAYDYFVAELQAWIEAIEINLQENHAREIVTVYGWMLEHHEQFIALSGDLELFEDKADPQTLQVRSHFLSSLLQGDSRACQKIGADYVQSREDVMTFYLQIIQPAMYEIGRCWEMGEVSVAQEHLASAIVARVMSFLYQDYVLGEERKERRAVVTAAPNEFHETGAHMISDFLEINGWDVYYLGSNTPARDLKDLVLQKKPFLLAISVTMPFNLSGVKEIVQMVRDEEALENIRIMLGGMVFNMESQLWKQLGADGWANDARGAVELADQWYKEAGGNGVA